MCFVVTCWERADLLALVCGVFCEFVTFPWVSCVRCGTWLYRFLIFAPLLTSMMDFYMLLCIFNALKISNFQYHFSKNFYIRFFLFFSQLVNCYLYFTILKNWDRVMFYFEINYIWCLLLSKQKYNVLRWTKWLLSFVFYLSSDYLSQKSTVSHNHCVAILNNTLNCGLMLIMI